MFLTVYLGGSEQHVSEVPVMPETLCRDVVELCKEPGEADCYLAELWRGSGLFHRGACAATRRSLYLLTYLHHVFASPERVVGDGERMFEVLQRWGHQGADVRYLLHHQRAPGKGDSGGSGLQSSFQSALMCYSFSLDCEGSQKTCRGLTH